MELQPEQRAGLSVGPFPVSVPVKRQHLLRVALSRGPGLSTQTPTRYGRPATTPCSGHYPRNLG